MKDVGNLTPSYVTLHSVVARVCSGEGVFLGNNTTFVSIVADRVCKDMIVLLRATLIVLACHGFVVPTRVTRPVSVSSQTILLLGIF